MSETCNKTQDNKYTEQCTLTKWDNRKILHGLCGYSSISLETTANYFLQTVDSILQLHYQTTYVEKLLNGETCNSKAVTENSKRYKRVPKQRNIALCL